MQLLKGKPTAERLLIGLKEDIESREKKPGLAVILVGNDPASEIYVKLKAQAAERVGVRFKLIRFRADVAEDKVIFAVKKLNTDENINGVIVQLPLPEKLDSQRIIGTIAPGKDADGIHPDNTKAFLAEKPSVYPAFPRAILKLLESSKTDLKGKQAVILANSREFGSVIRQALELKGVKAKYVLSKDLDRNLKLLKKADILVTAVGKPGLVRGDMLKKDVIAIDGGVTKTEKGVVGDVDFESVKKVAGFVSPVPGGVGPVTIACLLQNVVNLAENRIKYEKVY